MLDFATRRIAVFGNDLTGFGAYRLSIFDEEFGRKALTQCSEGAVSISVNEPYQRNH
jgi:hypothetical protein